MGRTQKVLMAALGVMVLYPASPGEAQLMEVRQAVFGMDCAPCAYAVERRMADLDGAARVTLSLNEGFAQVWFDDLHGTTLEEIRRAFRDSGFGARDARVRVRGRIVQEEGVLMLRTPAGERYRLRASEPANLPGPGREGEVEGQVGAGGSAVRIGPASGSTSSVSGRRTCPCPSPKHWGIEPCDPTSEGAARLRTDGAQRLVANGRCR